MGRPRDGDDRVAWLLQRRRFREALAIASTDRSLRKHSRPQVAPQGSVSWTAGEHPALWRFRCLGRGMTRAGWVLPMSVLPAAAHFVLHRAIRGCVVGDERAWQCRCWTPQTSKVFDGRRPGLSTL